MDKYELDLGVHNGTVEIDIIRKHIKNVHLKVFRDMTVKLSIPDAVPDEWIENFIKEKAFWIDKQLTKYKQSSGYNNLSSISNGSSIQLLGKDVRVFKTAAPKNCVEIDEKNLTLYLIDPNDDNKANKLFNQFWRDEARNIYQKEMDVLFASIFKKYSIQKPDIAIKKMKTLWGSCTKAKNKITLNEYLLKADVRCIQYVILHELTHLLHTYHNKDFYNFLTIQMPDWKERKKQLDKEVVQGL